MAAGEASGSAFVERFEVPPLASGPLDGLSFAAKDLFAPRIPCPLVSTESSRNASGRSSPCSSGLSARSADVQARVEAIRERKTFAGGAQSALQSRMA